MKKKALLITMIAAITISLTAISPYYKMEVRSGTIGEMSQIVRDKLEAGGFTILGESYPGDTDHLYVIAFTSKELTDLALSVEDRGILASVLKVGITHYDGKVTVSILNPEYIFYGYLRSAMDDSGLSSGLKSVSDNIIAAMTFEGTTPEPFGGDVEIKNLKKYRFMAGMPNFEKAVELKTFSSFESGLETIRKNLEAGRAKTELVYEYVIEGKDVAVFGVALNDQAKGSAKFLPIIGEDHIAAMPYEIVLQGNRATMLHGKFRFALHWPELKMTTFAKIMSSPGDVEDMLKALTE